MDEIELNSIAKRLLARKIELKRCQAEVNSLTSVIEAELFSRGINELVGTGWKATCKPVTSKRVDVKALKKELPEVAARYSKTTTVNRLLLKAREERMVYDNKRVSGG